MFSDIYMNTWVLYFDHETCLVVSFLFGANSNVFTSILIGYEYCNAHTFIVLLFKFSFDVIVSRSNITSWKVNCFSL